MARVDFQAVNPNKDTRRQWGKIDLKTDSQLLEDSQLNKIGVAPSASISFDALVDGSLTASAPTKLQFKGIGEAINYLHDTLGLQNYTIIIRPYSSAYVETADITQGAAHVKLIGAPNITYAANPSLPGVAWKVRNVTLNSLTLEDVNLGAAANNMTLTCNSYFMALRCDIGDNVFLAGGWTIAGGSLIAMRDCQIDIQNMAPVDFNAQTIWCSGYVKGTFSFTASNALEISAEVYGGGTLSLVSKRTIANLQQVFGFIGSSGGGATATVIFNMSTGGSVEANVIGLASQITNGSAVVAARVHGTYDTMPTINAGLVVFDITLTALDTISAGQGIVRLAVATGAGLTVSGGGPWNMMLSLPTYTGAAVLTALTVSNVTDSLFTIAAHNNAGTNKKGYAFAATTARCKVDFAGQSTFDIASTDAGAGNVLEVT